MKKAVKVRIKQYSPAAIALPDLGCCPIDHSELTPEKTCCHNFSLVLRSQCLKSVWMCDSGVFQMLNNTNPAMLRCLEKAAECDRRAQEAIDSHGQEMYRRMAENWRFLSETHQHIVRMESFLG